MNTEDVEIFLKIYETKSISAAAASLFHTQSSVSKRLENLEKNLGYPLFVRGRGITNVLPTVAGERFYPIARQMASLMEDAERIGNAGNKKRLRIAAPDSIVSYRLRRFFSELTTERSDWEIEINMADTLPICEMVRNRTIDVGIINGKAPFFELSAEELFSEPYVVLASEELFGKRESLNISALDPSNEIHHMFGDEYRRWHDYWFRQGLAKAKVNLAHVAVDMLIHKEDWTILPLSVAKTLCPDGFRIYMFESNGLQRAAILITHAELSAERRTNAKELIDLLKRECRSDE